jgi:hypothetical protein
MNSWEIVDEEYNTISQQTDRFVEWKLEKRLRGSWSTRVCSQNGFSPMKVPDKKQ